MPRVSSGTELEYVEHILGSGTGTLDFAVEGENAYYTWEGEEEADWTIENVQRIENDQEDRFIAFPEDDYFTCKITIDDSGEETVSCR